MKFKKKFINAREKGYHTNGYIKETAELKFKILRMSADSLIVTSKN
jgi:hypothetical protein